MSESGTASVSISTAGGRCWKCHRWHWWETVHGNHGSPGCPFCLSARVDQLLVQESKLELRIRALKGVVTRLRRVIKPVQLEPSMLKKVRK